MAFPFPASLVRERLMQYASRLRFPKLLALTALVFMVDLIVPDIIPFADEILLGLAAMLLAIVKKRKEPDQEAPEK